MDKIKLKVFLLLVFTTTLVITSSNEHDVIGLKSLDWTKKPRDWEGSDPCGANWVGISCTESRVNTIRLSSMGLKGQLSGAIEQLSELETLDLSSNKELGGPLPQSIVNLKKLVNFFSGQIPDTIGSLKELVILSLNSNKFNGSIPATIGNLHKLDWLDLTDNDIEGPIPVSNESSPGLDLLLVCKHLLLDGNKLGGNIPSTLGLVRSLTFLVMEDTKLQGEIPGQIFNLPNLMVVKLKNNKLNGTLHIGESYSEKLQLIDLQTNLITEFDNSEDETKVQIKLEGNPICQETGTTHSYCCNASVSLFNSSYITERNNCSPSPCSSDQTSSPSCRCAYPYKGTLIFTAPTFDLGNTSCLKELEKSLMELSTLSVDSVSLSNPTMNPSEYSTVRLNLFPKGRDRFKQTEISDINYALNFNVAIRFRPFDFIGDVYQNYAGIEEHTESKKPRIGIFIGAASVVFTLVLLLLAALFAFRHRRRAGRATELGNPSGSWSWTPKFSSENIPQLKGARWFSVQELKKYSNNFSAENEIGSGGYGKVYRGTLPTRELIAIKRAKRETKQGGTEFRTEVELLSRVHHKNLVRLVGFCIEQGEQMLIYEYVPNGNLKDTLSGKSGIRFDWMRRLRVALGTARGLAYLHELVNPPIIHRDIKSSNVLLDGHLNAKVADFGLSKLMGDDEKDHVSTQVKGTMGYLDPEYYTTQQLTEKSDVYSFGVLMLELITARKPIEQGVYIVKEVRQTMDESKYLYSLHTLLDPAICLETRLNGLERFVNLAMRCLENERVNRPRMSEVVKEIERIMDVAGLNPSEDSTSISASYEESIKASSSSPYSLESFEQSSTLPPPTIESHSH
ncbi:Mitogen-activated protein kinase kinase kinase [Parasponia andersonii]|uniref:non-specific serine/threonine protein kinase n=1 Tax=Parasponia andersonii TaxID=3476 RepID=A0A2P5AQ60_PARAD|nr:Mitogen-activated protein kinase kinase kinase [Parasponia andersonii]